MIQFPIQQRATTVILLRQTYNMYGSCGLAGLVIRAFSAHIFNLSTVKNIQVPHVSFFLFFLLQNFLRTDCVFEKYLENSRQVNRFFHFLLSNFQTNNAKFGLTNKKPYNAVGINLFTVFIYRQTYYILYKNNKQSLANIYQDF